MSRRLFSRDSAIVVFCSRHRVLPDSLSILLQSFCASNRGERTSRIYKSKMVGRIMISGVCCGRGGRVNVVPDNCCKQAIAQSNRGCAHGYAKSMSLGQKAMGDLPGSLSAIGVPTTRGTARVNTESMVKPLCRPYNNLQ